MGGPQLRKGISENRKHLGPRTKIAAQSPGPTRGIRGGRQALSWLVSLVI